MPRDEPGRVAILGAGPIGLEAALYAERLKLQVTVYERGQPGEYLRRWGHVRMFSPFAMNHTPLGLEVLQRELANYRPPAATECVTGRAHLTAYVEPLAKSSVLRERIRLGEQVVQVGRRGYLKTEGPGDVKRLQEPFLLLIRDAQGKERVDEADIVLDCTGTYGLPNRIGDGGLSVPGEKQTGQAVDYGVEDVLGEKRGAYAGKNIVVIGAGYSAATTVCNLATLAGLDAATWTVWLARGAGSQPIRRIMNDPLAERDKLARKANTLATRAEGNIEFFQQTVVEALEPMQGGVRLVTRCAGKKKNFETERVIANIGYRPDLSLFQELQVHQCYASEGPMALAAALLKQGGGDCMAIPSFGPASLRTTEPGFFVLGAKSYGRNSHFLLRTGFEQIRDVFAMVTGKSDLDLYRGRLGKVAATS